MYRYPFISYHLCFIFLSMTNSSDMQNNKCDADNFISMLVELKNVSNNSFKCFNGTLHLK